MAAAGANIAGLHNAIVSEAYGVRVFGLQCGIQCHKIAVGTGGVFRCLAPAAIVDVKVAMAGYVFKVFLVSAQGVGGIYIWSPLWCGKHSPVGFCVALCDAAQSETALHAPYGACAVGIAVCPRAIHRVAVKRITDDGRVVGAVCDVIEALRTYMVVVFAAGRGVAQAVIKARPLEVIGVLVPDPEIVVAARILCIEDGHSIAEHAHMPQANSRGRAGIWHGITGYLVHEVHIGGYVGIHNPWTYVVAGYAGGAHVHIGGAVLH